MKIGDYIEQKNTDTTALIIEELKNGSFKALVHDYRGRIIKKSISGWYPAPVVINKDIISPKILNKIDKYISIHS